MNVSSQGTARSDSPLHAGVASEGGADQLQVDLHRLQAFEQQLDPARPFSGPVPARVLGWGDLSTAFELDGLPGLAFKRMPPFDTVEARAYHQRAVENYRHLLNDRLGLRVVPQRCIPLTSRTGEHILYIVQAQQPAERIGPAVLARCTEREAIAVYEALLDQVARVWYRNEIDAPNSLTGLDARLGNWSVTLEEGEVTRLLYLDTSTPFFRRIGRDLMDPEVFLKRVADPWTGLLRPGFLAMLDRYYDLRVVLIDFLADFHREGLADHLPLALQVVNRFVERSAEDLYLDPITRQEVDRHYKQDARFWSRFLAFSRLSRFMQVHLHGRPYGHILPERRKG